MNIYTKSYKEKSLKSCSSTLNAYIIFLTSIQTSTLCKLGYNSCFAKLYYVHSQIVGDLWSFGILFFLQK